jgi:hypothetical protein
MNHVFMKMTCKHLTGVWGILFPLLSFSLFVSEGGFAFSPFGLPFAGVQKQVSRWVCF